MFVIRLRVIRPCASRNRTPDSAYTPSPSIVTPEMLTVSSLLRSRLSLRVPAGFWSAAAASGAACAVSAPSIITIAPSALRRLGVFSAIWLVLARTFFGLIVTRSAPAPLIVTSRMMIRPFVPTPPPPSTYVPGQTAMVAPSGAAKIAFWIVLYGAAGQSRLSSSTISGGSAAFATCANAKVPSAAATAAQALRPFTFRPTPFDPLP